MTPDETLKQLMDAIQVKCGDGYLDALHALLGLFSLHEEGKGMPHGLPYTAAQELMETLRDINATDMIRDYSEPMQSDVSQLIASATPPVEQGEET